jgi:hypothetical protein
MNTTRRGRLIAATLTLTLMSLIFASQVLAAPAAEPTAAPAAQAQDGQEKPQASPEELERFRADLIRFVQAYKELAALATPKDAPRFNGIEKRLHKLSHQQLNVIRRGMPDFSVVGRTATRLSNSVAKSKSLSGATSAKLDGLIEPLSPGFPTADYPSCGSTRTDESTIDAADIALFVAEGVKDLASRGCDEVIVVGGFGGNGSLVCIITDEVYVAAKAVNYGLHFCNAKIDAAEQLAAYERLDHLHSDLESSVANDNTNTQAITGAVNTAKTNIINNDDANATNIIANDNTNKNTIISNDNTNAANLTALVNQALATIINNANSNKEELKNLLLRTQIEADLATADNAVPVALYETPGTTCNPSLANPPTQCGHLNLVRTIVKETIANVAGPNTAKANALLAQGDAQKAAGNYKQAYLTYRQAYKTAAK